MKKKNIDPNLLTKKSSWWEAMATGNALELFPGREDWKERLIYTLNTWADRKDALALEGFCEEYKLHRDQLYEMRDNYPEIKKAVDRVKVRIGHKRRMGALFKQFDAGVVFKDMHRYDPEWLDINKYNAEIKKQEQKDSVVTIYDSGGMGRPSVKPKEEVDQEQATLHNLAKGHSAH